MMWNSAVVLRAVLRQKAEEQKQLKSDVGRMQEEERKLLEMKRQTKAGLIPDVRAMEAGIKLYLAYAVGLPVQRQELVTVAINADSMTGLRERLKSSPAMRDALAGLLAEVAEESTKTDDTPAGDSLIIDG